VKRFLVPLAIASAATVICQVAVCQVPTAPNSTETKYVIVPMPKGRVNAHADEVDKNWTSHIVHLKGNANVRIYTDTKDPRGVVVMHADEVDLNESTGDISPRGNVRLTVEDRK
jgi:lipopolysaccharide assembly outer membrane protein LptD (OstA)